MDAGDRELLSTWFSDPAISLAWCGVVLSAAEIAQRFHGAEFDAGRGSFIAMLAGKPVGYLAYDAFPGGEIALHIMLIPAARGRGVGSRALRLLADLLAATLDPPRLLALPSPDNLAVIGALRRAGFTQRDPNWSLLERASPPSSGGGQPGS